MKYIYIFHHILQIATNKRKKKHLASFCGTGRVSGVMLSALSDHVISRAQGWRRWRGRRHLYGQWHLPLLLQQKLLLFVERLECYYLYSSCLSPSSTIKLWQVKVGGIYPFYWTHQVWGFEGIHTFWASSLKHEKISPMKPWSSSWYIACVRTSA